METKPSEFTDEEVIQFLLSGEDSKALEFLYRHILPKVRHFVSRYYLDIAIADDVFQEATLVFYEYVKNGKFDQKYTIQTFITTIAKRKLIDILRKDARNSDLESVKTSDLHHEDLETRIINDDTLNKVEEVLATLGGKCKDLIINYEFHGYSMKEICGMMGFKNEQTAKASKYKCKKKLIQLFECNPELLEYFKN